MAMSKTVSLFGSLGQAADFEKKLAKRGVLPEMVRVAGDNAWCLDEIAETFKSVFGIKQSTSRERLRVEVPSIGQMMQLSDHELIAAYVNHMAIYKLPIKCKHPGCDVIIYNVCDLRKLSGRPLCPEHYRKELLDTMREGNRNGVFEYLERVMHLLPPRMLGMTPSEAKAN